MSGQTSAFRLVQFLLLALLAGTCAREEKGEALFTLLPSSRTGVNFSNTLQHTETYNAYTFRNFYNGAGVGIGDVNNDGLADLYFCGNLEDNKLYLNRGDFRFEDATEKAGVACRGVWSTGVSLADVNGDGWLDIYVCKSGDPSGANRHNELFINNQDGTFTEQAKAWGIADLGLSVHAAFFDYDRDGDLDCYLLNNSIRPVGGYDYRPGQREIRDTTGGNKLYRNDGGRFTDVSAAAGIYGSAIGFGLGVTIGDVNRDGWQDIFVSNDFFERDYLYINNQDGTFTEALEQQIREISMGSMGADMADINNDGYPEIYVTDMLPETDERMKTKTRFENWDKYQLGLRNGFYHQFTRNVLQLNNRDGTFSEIGRLAGVHATDWSWGALIADFDNDGWKDIFVANGIFKDLTDQDYINFYSDPEKVRELIKEEREGAVTRMIDEMPSEAIPNYAFRNNGDLTFSNVAEQWGLAQPSFSNGAAYGDLDNDGDLDLVVNNVNMPAFVYRNEAATQSSSRFLVVDLEGAAPNTHAFGAQVSVYHQGKVWYQEQAPMRGFQSSVGQRLHFGLGALETADSLMVLWPDGSQSVQTNVETNQVITLKQEEAQVPAAGNRAPEGAGKALLFQPYAPATPPVYTHRENDFIDFDRDRLLYHMLSREGPPIAVGDANGDGLDDFYIGGAKGSPGALLLQQAGGGFAPSNQALWAEAIDAEDSDALFFDADQDGDLDLYVASGSNEYSSLSFSLLDRLYFNDGRGGFVQSPQLLPAAKPESTGTVEAADFDGDGDLDLFVGIRLRPFLYGVPVNGYLLENDGKGQFRNITPQVAPALKECGLITDAAWVDYDGDGRPDLVAVGEWMPVRVFRNEPGRLREVTAELGLEGSNGLWNTVETGDLNQDGRPDLALGNHGWNTRFRASPDKPMTLYVNDFDQNGTVEQIISVYNGDKAYPLALRHDLIQQMPGLKKKYLRYENYKNQTVEDIFTPPQLENAVKREVYQTATCVAFNEEGRRFVLRPLPVQAQLSPTYAILLRDFDRDGRQDMLLGGNFYHAKPEVGIHDASYGLLLKANPEGWFDPLLPRESGFFVKGEIRELKWAGTPGGGLILVGRNDAPLLIFSSAGPTVQ
ncbi:MAG: VCBS repeat-containing protein [Lewinellaceae bacterium]|nr:VCBS repeat-containing protein [Lewinellaceae bacterium]